MIYDVVIVGGGPAGLTAGLYCARRTLKTLILAKDLGGQMATTSEIENYPGFEIINGAELALKMKNQAEKFGAKFKIATVEKITPQDNRNFIIEYAQEKVVAQSVILAFGLTPRNLEVPGEKEFTGKGVSYCANCDAPLFKDKLVAVVGGGNSALDAADYLSRIAQQTYLIHRREQFRGEEVMVQEVINNRKIKILYNTIVIEIKGNQLVNGITIENIKDKSKKNLVVDGIFIEIGRQANTQWLENLVKLNEKKEIIVDYNGHTNFKGIFGAGDVTNVSQKQIAVATGEGVKAALACYTYLLKKKGQSIPGVDWGKRNRL